MHDRLPDEPDLIMNIRNVDVVLASHHIILIHCQSIHAVSSGEDLGLGDDAATAEVRDAAEHVPQRHLPWSIRETGLFTPNNPVP